MSEVSQEKKNIGSLFNRIAGSYDRFNHLLSFNIDKLWRKKAVRGMLPAENVLDVAIGTADLAIELLRRGKAQKVTGIDLSTEMMRIGEEKTRRAGYDVKFVEGSAQEMPFGDSEYDALTCSYGCRNFSDLDAGLREFYRVLKPGGEVMILEFSYPENKVIRWAYDIYFKHFMPLLGKILTHDRSAFNYFYHSVRNFVWGDDFCEHLRQAGFSEATHKPITFGVTTIYRAKK